MNWINYLLEANLYMVLFYAAYRLLLHRDTYYQLNRIYLIATSLLSLAIPLVQIGVLKPAPVTLPPVLVSVPYPVAFDNIPVEHTIAVPTLTINYFVLVYSLCALAMAVALVLRIYQLIKMARNGSKRINNQYKIIELEDDDRAFSFFGYLFIGKKLASSSTIIQHELVHIRQKHSMDIMYFELLKIICWFNPAVYLMQNSVKEVHEYLADNYLANHGQDVNHYTDFLISNAYGLPEMAMANNFFNKNLLKNRIMMLHQKRSGSLARLKYLVALPLLAGMLCLSTLGFTKNYSMIDLAPAKAVTHANAPAMNQNKSKLPITLPDKSVQPQTPKMPPPPPPLTGTTRTGYKYNQEGFVSNGKTDFKVSITEKNGKVVDYYKSKATPAVLKMLSMKYGYTFPSADKIKFPQPIVAPDKPLKPGKVRFPQPVAVPDKPGYDTIGRTAFEPFYKELARNIRYPTEARDNNQQGHVFVIFNVDDNNKPYNFLIARGLSVVMNNEVIRVLANCTLPATVRKDVNYTIPISFSIQDKTTGKWLDNAPATNIETNPAINKAHRSLGYKTNLALNEVVITSYK
ncbi:M56 family metallopeptidase [Mucilaginibacter boryungensis]|uniref:Energy transducer TonB n=1 Tax=Mucilaginibacter boryungensis TaxID=768480 RepID=A0ABR9XI82_9SPHI|nr:M56 family metallopeptidase [Mucilaginibacter boryungensis]MBE9666718.1 energy transducer TonB [Mucilaginibacter boryungensis]